MKTYKKQSLRAGLYFGILMSIFSIAQYLIKGNNFSLTQILKYVALGLISGTIGGVAFGFLIGLFIKSKFVNSITAIETELGENIIFETRANHFRGIEAVGGKLYLTNKKLIFKPHKLNIQNHQLSILVNDITTVNRYKTLGLINNGLSVVNKNGTVEKFVVNNIKEWNKWLSGKRNLAQQTSHSIS